VALFELKPVRQLEGEMLRRWFDDDQGFFDLIAWIDDSGEVSGFQLSYDVNGNERAITWLGGAFSHRNVDAGDDSPLSNDSSILTGIAIFSAADLAERFRESSRGIDPLVREVLLERLAEFAEEARSPRSD
jgi:hypothetical protein